jgi:hypothetical protein
MAEFRRRGLIHIEKGGCVDFDHNGLMQLAHG